MMMMIRTTTCLNSVRHLPSVWTWKSRNNHHVRGSEGRLEERYRSQTMSCRAVEQGDAVEIHYLETLAENPEVVVRNSRERKDSEEANSLQFIVGAGKMIKGLEDLVVGMNIGETKQGTVEAERAYGSWRKDLTAQVKKSQAPDGLGVGMMVSLQNGMKAVVTDEDPESFTIDANHPLAGKEMAYEVELLSCVKHNDLEEAYFGGGCFWGVELKFQRVPGVINTEVGYCNGHVDTVTYEDVCSGQTGHNEVVRVTYDSSLINLKDLIGKFCDIHDPTELNRQGNDVGTQYRSGIYVTTPEQKKIAEEAIESLQNKFSGQIVTEIDMVDKFNSAEEYHQQYLEKGGRFGRPQSAAKGCTDPVRCYG
jgi:peptide-methionine (S)-S-oxide reductase